MVAVVANLPNGRKVYFDTNGAPLAGGTVTYYVPSTTTLTTVYLDPQQTTPAPNPVILDAAGSCAIYASGQFREYVKDVRGNLISDTLVSALSGATPLTLTDLGVSAAMLPVLQAASVAAAEALLNPGGGSSASGTHLSLNPGDQTLSVQPTANAFPTFASLNVQGTSVSATNREFLVNLGLTSNKGTGQAGKSSGGINPDKCTLYAGMTAQNGTSDVWAMNPVLTMEASSGAYSAQGIELDFNNNSVNRGAAGNLSADFTAPVCNGLLVTGASQFSSGCGIAIESNAPAAHPGVKQWARGLTTQGTFGLCSIQDWSTSPVGIQFDGAYATAAINMTSLYQNAGAIGPTALFMKNGQNLAWQSNDATKVVIDSVDTSNNRIVGAPSVLGGTNSIILCASTIPQVNGLGLGTVNNRWGDLYATNLRLPNNTVVSMGTTTGGQVLNFVDQSNNLILGSGANFIIAAQTLAPNTTNLNLGTTNNPWGTVFAGSMVTPSDIALKKEVLPLAGMLAKINAITPISFSWTNQPRYEEQTHFGFDADDVLNTFGYRFAGYQNTDGSKWLDKTELIAVLWQGIKELAARVTTLEQR